MMILIEKVPDEFKGLSQLEEMLIARIYPLITVYTVKGGQRKGSKHVINFPQSLNRLATQLPYLPGDVPLVVRRSNRQEGGHYDFRVRRDKVRAALVWLRTNNRWYHDIDISPERMAQLPLDGNLEHCFWPNDEMTNGESENTIDGEEEDENDESVGMKC